MVSLEDRGQEKASRGNDLIQCWAPRAVLSASVPSLKLSLCLVCVEKGRGGFTPASSHMGYRHILVQTLPRQGREGVGVAAPEDR